jgi:hypothetical protein
LFTVRDSIGISYAWWLAINTEMLAAFRLLRLHRIWNGS